MLAGPVQVPNLGFVPPDYDADPVRHHSHAIHNLPTVEGCPFGAARCIPKPRRPVGRTRDDARSVRRKGYAEYLLGVAVENGQLGTCPSIPDARRVITRASHNPPAIWAHGESLNFS